VSALRKAARAQSCVRCEADDGTINSCHYSGPWQHRFGKGRGIKGDDIAAADLCDKCHRYFDEYESDNDAARSDEFLAMCILTLIRRRRQGKI